jgi:hypothetical protein
MISLAGYSLSSHYTQKFPAVEKETNRHHSTELLFHPERKNKKIFFPIPSPLHHSGGIKETHTQKRSCLEYNKKRRRRFIVWEKKKKSNG